MSSSLGIYFGPKIINIVESQGKHILNNIQIDTSAISAGEFEEKIPDEIKIVALIKDELRRNKIDVNEVNVSIAGKDLIVRTFDMPLMPNSELSSAVFFESKKYLPFKAEDLVSDYQLRTDRFSRRNLVLFEAIKKESLDKYLSILNQLGIKINAIEYSALGVLRFLKLNGVAYKGIVAVVSADLKEKDEVTFLVLDNGFPLFSRDVNLDGSSEAGAPSFEAAEETAAVLDKLKTEIKVSLDYYNRKFSSKKINKILFVTNQEYAQDLEGFAKEMLLPGQFIDAVKYIGKSLPFSLSFIKGYGSSLYKTVKTEFKIDLLAARDKIKIKPLSKETPDIKVAVSSLTAGLKVDFRAVIASLLICGLVFVFGSFRKTPVRIELEELMSQRPVIKDVNPSLSYEELSAFNTEYKNKINKLSKVIKDQVYLTDLLNTLPVIMPKGLWLEGLSFALKGDNKGELILEGRAYLGNSEEEFALVNSFVATLRKNANFNKYFKDINVMSLRTQEEGKVIVTSFMIVCKD